jgi:molybdate transport system ATP-binding protein
VITSSRTNQKDEESALGLVLSLDCVTAGRPTAVLHEVSWQLRDGELWAVVGPNGAGKSTLLGVLQGQVPVLRGDRHYGGHALGRALATDPYGQLLSVSFGAQAPLLHGAAGYTQSRWHAGHDHAVVRGRDLLGAALDDGESRRIIDDLGLGAVLDRRLTELSNGERRKLVLARAAARRPAILALDNPFNGLDAAARASVADAMGRLHGDGTLLLVTTSREDEISLAVTHVLLLDRGRVVMSGPKDAVLADERFDAHMRKRQARRSTSDLPATRPARRPTADAPPVVELSCVQLTYGDTGVLREMSWTVRRGERWVVLGPNGAGKSALLSLILADNPQAYANDVSLFGRRRGSGDTIWEIRERIGCVSPEMHLYEELDRRVVDVIGSGFLDPVGSQRPLTANEVRETDRWIVALDLECCRDRRLRELSEGERQMALLGRALARRPELLVLDEPCQGLDAARVALFLELLERELRSRDTTLIYVTHDLDEVPSAATHGLHLRQGRSVVQDSAEEVLRAYGLARPSSPPEQNLEARSAADQRDG